MRIEKAAEWLARYCIEGSIMRKDESEYLKAKNNIKGIVYSNLYDCSTPGAAKCFTLDEIAGEWFTIAYLEESNPRFGKMYGNIGEIASSIKDNGGGMLGWWHGEKRFIVPDEHGTISRIDTARGTIEPWTPRVIDLASMLWNRLDDDEIKTLVTDEYRKNIKMGYEPGEGDGAERFDRYTGMVREREMPKSRWLSPKAGIRFLHGKR